MRKGGFTPWRTQPQEGRAKLSPKKDGKATNTNSEKEGPIPTPSKKKGQNLQKKNEKKNEKKGETLTRRTWPEEKKVEKNK